MTKGKIAVDPIFIRVTAISFSINCQRQDYTPKHGSWLDIAEIELNVMTRQCLSHRIAEIDLLRSELSAWEAERNTAAAKVDWHFRTGDARIKLSSLYPTFTTAP